MSLKIIAFPFAGGNQYSFNFLKEELSTTKINLVVLEYPGRGRRVKEPFMNTIEEIVDDLFVQVKREIQFGEYVLYGHSMGALVAYLIGQKIMKESLKKPLKLIVSGASAPSKNKKKNTYQLPSEDFWHKVDELGGLPEDIIKEQSLRSFFEPILRSDFKVIHHYDYSGSSLLDIPIDVFFGDQEKMEIEEIVEWKTETTGEVNIRKLSGDHFFIMEHHAFFIKYFASLSSQLNYQ